MILLKGSTLDVSSNTGLIITSCSNDDMPIQDQLLIILFHLPILLKEAATLQWTFQDKAVVY
jgi:hypothetical protein